MPKKVGGKDHFTKEEKRKMKDEMIADLNREKEKSSVYDDKKFQEHRAEASQFNPAVVDSEGKAHSVKPLGLHQEAYMVRKGSKNTRVVDEQEKIDVDYSGCQLIGEKGTPYWSDKHKDVMRVMITKDGSTVAFKEKDIVPVKKKNFSLNVSQRRYNEIFKKKQTV